MVDVVSIASYISERYLKEYGERIDEMKLHKLLYLTQRECLIQTGEPMFEATFHAWKYGPVLPEIRQLYKTDALKRELPKEQEERYKEVLDVIFNEFAHKRAFVLSNLTHGDYSWRHAREGYGKYEDSDVPMLMEDIKKDADYFRQRRVMLKVLEKSGINRKKPLVFVV
jgi:uncharacterized phage-associated protein